MLIAIICVIIPAARSVPLPPEEPAQEAGGLGEGEQEQRQGAAGATPRAARPQTQGGSPAARTHRQGGTFYHYYI